MELHDIREMATHELKRMYSAHQQFVEQVPRMRQMASLPFLSECFEDEQQKAQNHNELFEQLFNQLGAEPGSIDDKTMRSIFSELDELEPDKSSPAVVDAKLVDIGRKANLYLEASFGTMTDVAEQMRMRRLAELLHNRLHEVDQSAEKLLNAVPDVVYV
jgi:ferritin-like metal-binding protein YciE